MGVAVLSGVLDSLEQTRRRMQGAASEDGDESDALANSMTLEPSDRALPSRCSMLHCCSQLYRHADLDIAVQLHCDGEQDRERTQAQADLCRPGRRAVIPRERAPER